MGDTNKRDKRTEIIMAANHLALYPLQSARENKEKLFQKMSAADYMTMWMLAKMLEQPDAEQKMYLSDIADRLRLPMEKVSKMAKELQERNLVKWEHDGNGEEGTYILITENGLHMAAEQSHILEEFYRNVIKKFGEEKFVDLLRQIAHLEEVMSEEIEKIGG